MVRFETRVNMFAEEPDWCPSSKVAHLNVTPLSWTYLNVSLEGAVSKSRERMPRPPDPTVVVVAHHHNSLGIGPDARRCSSLHKLTLHRVGQSSRCRVPRHTLTRDRVSQ